VVFGVRLFEHFDERVGLIENEGHAVNAVVDATHKFFGPPNTELLDNGFICVGDQWEVQLVFVDEFTVGSNAISADANDVNLRC